MHTPRFPRNVFCAVAGLVLACGSLFAEQPNFSLGDVTISATPPPPAAVTAAETTITEAQIAASGATTLGGVLAQTASVTVVSDGPAGSLVSASMQGSTANQVLVLVNGVPLNNPLTGAVDLSLIPLAEIDHIKIIRGGAAALYGPGAIGGVIDIVTKRSATSPLSLTLENGSYRPLLSSEPSGYWPLLDSQAASLTGGMKLGSATLVATGGVKRAANEYSYQDSTGAWKQLSNAALLGANGSVNMRTPLASGRLSLFGSGAYHSHGVPGSESFPSPLAHETDATAGGTLRYTTEHFLSNLFDLSLTAHGGYSSVAYGDPQAGVDSLHQLWTARASATQDAYLGNTVKLGYGVSGTFNRVISSDVGVHTRLEAGAYFSPEISFGRLSLQPALRYDVSNDFLPGAVSFLFDAAYHLSSQLTLSAGASRSVRFPTIDDLYWPAGAGTAGNPNLVPETAWGSTAGISAHDGRIAYRLSAFTRYTRNLILWEPGSNGVWSPTNYGVALYPGIEQQLTVRLPAHLSLRLGYSLLYSFALSGGLTLGDNRRMAMTPVHTVSAVVEQDVGPLSWSLNAKYESKRYLSSANTAFLPSFLVVGGNLKWQFSSHWSSFLAVDNLFGEQYQLEAGYPMPPAELRVGVVGSL